jgi:hypothetical protein
MKLIGVNREFSGYFISRMGPPPSGGDAHRGGLGEVEGVSLGSLLRKYAYRGGIMGDGVSSVAKF